MKALYALLALSITACSAHSDKLSTDTAGIVAIEIDGQMRAFVFVSDHGKVMPVPAEQCGQDEHCSAMVKRYDDTGRTKVLQFDGAQLEDDAHSMPHRPMHEVDIQGHPNYGTLDDPCPHRIAIYVPETGYFLECVG